MRLCCVAICGVRVCARAGGLSPHGMGALKSSRRGYPGGFGWGVTGRQTGCGGFVMSQRDLQWRIA